MKKFAYLSLVSLMALGMLLAACNPIEKAPAAEITAPDTTGDAAVATQPVIVEPTVVSIIVSTDATFPPFELVDETTRELAGFDIDLMNAIAEINGWTIEWVDTPFDAALAGVAECQYDLSIAAISITEERLANMDFSDPYYSSGQVVVVSVDETEIASKDDLNGKTVAAQLGTTGEIEAQAIADVNYRPYDTYGLAFQDLMNDQIDAVIVDTPIAMGFVEANPDKLMIVGEQFTGESYGIAVCKERTDLIDPINTALASLTADGTLSSFVMTWIAGSSD